MRKTISFLLISNTGSSARQVTASRPFFCFLCSVGVVCFLFLGAMVYDYYRIKKSVPGTEELQSQIDSHVGRIRTQREHIRDIAGEINSLKSKLLALNKFEEKVRIIANIGGATNQEGLFGVGGAIPEDLDANISLMDDHASLIRDMHDQVRQLELASTNQEGKFESLLDALEDKQNLLACTPAIRPTTGWLSSGFGYRISPFTGLREFHKGMDIANQEGTPIVATADGVVTFVGRKGLLGQVVTVDHGHGMVTRYGHIKEARMKRGEAVKRGDVIALVGATGRTTGPHLHYEVILNGIRVNPSKYILN